MRSRFLSATTGFAILWSVGIVLLGAMELSAQANSPLGYKTRFPRIGFEGGIDLTKQDGLYTVGCGQFTEGSAVNVILGLTWEVPFGQILRGEIFGGYRTVNLSGEYEGVEPSVIRTADAFLDADVNYNNVGEAGFSFLFAQPSLKYYPFEWLYAGVGFQTGLNVSSKTQYTKEILTTVVTDSSGAPVEVFYPADESSDPHSKVFPVEDPENATSIFFDPVIYTGFEFRFGREFYLGPRVTYTFPLLPLITDPELNYSGLQITLGVRYDLR